MSDRPEQTYHFREDPERQRFTLGRRPGRPLGHASGGDPGFWEKLGTEETGLPTHLPMGVTQTGQGPEDDRRAHHYVCWCGDVECPLTIALVHAWSSGRLSEGAIRHDG